MSRNRTIRLRTDRTGDGLLVKNLEPTTVKESLERTEVCDLVRFVEYESLMAHEREGS